MHAWATFAEQSATHDLCYVYGGVWAMGGQFNHPPGIAVAAAAIFRLAGWAHLPFYFCFKVILPVAGDILTAWLLWLIWVKRSGRSGAAWAVAAFAWSLDAILLSSFHGNTDSLCVALSFLALFLIEERDRVGLGGLSLAAAVNVKLIPLLLVPLMLAVCGDWKRRLRFALGFAAGLLPFVPTSIACGATLLERVGNYSPRWEHWGIPFLLLQQSTDLRQFGALAARRWFYEYLRSGRTIVMGATLLVAAAAFVMVRRRPSPLRRYQAAAMVMALFLILAPGFGLQYTVYVVPFLFAVEIAPAALYSTVAGAFLLAVYVSFMKPKEFPIDSYLFGRYPIWCAWIGVMAWVILFGIVARIVRNVARDVR